MKTKLYIIKAGFTLIELLIVLAFLSIIMGVAVPSFGNMVQRNRDVSIVNQLLADVRLARTEAIKRRVNVQVVSAAGGWSNGWIVEEAVSGDDIRIAAALTNATITTAETTNLAFDTRGVTNQTNAYVLVYTPGDCTDQRQVTINISIFARISKVSGNCP